MTGLSLLCSCLLSVSPVFVSVIFYFTRTTVLWSLLVKLKNIFLYFLYFLALLLLLQAKNKSSVHNPSWPKGSRFFLVLVSDYKSPTFPRTNKYSTIFRLSCQEVMWFTCWVINWVSRYGKDTWIMGQL